MKNYTFYKLIDPRTEEIFSITYTEGRLPEELRRLNANALNNKEKSELDLWILELMEINRSPLIENLGQKQLNDIFHVEEHIKTLKENHGLNKEDKRVETFPEIKRPVYHPYDQENVEEILEEHFPEQVKPYLEDKAKKEEVKKKPATKRKTTAKKKPATKKKK